MVWDWRKFSGCMYHLTVELHLMRSFLFLFHACSESEAVTKTYAVHAVSDVKNTKRLTFDEAVACGIIDTESGAYRNSMTGECMYVGDAIKKGFIKAAVVKDPTAFDIAPGSRFSMDDNVTGRNIIKKFQQPTTVLGAFSRPSYSNGNYYK